MHNLSFWEAPDWRRESTLSPNFLMGIVIALFAVVGLGAVSCTYTSANALKSELSGLQSSNQEIADTAEQVEQQRARTEVWRSVLEELEAIEDKRLIVSRQLEALQAAVPPSIILDSLEFYAKRVKREMQPLADGRKREETVLQYAMSLSGTASGDNAQAAIAAFANRLRPGADSIIGRQLLSSELKNISGGQRGGNTKSFRIECEYQPAE